MRSQERRVKSKLINKNKLKLYHYRLRVIQIKTYLFFMCIQTFIKLLIIKQN